MSSPDKSFKSYYPESGNVSGEYLDPTRQSGWLPGSWSDTAHFSKCMAQVFETFVAFGGKEDCIDLNNGCCANVFSDFDLYAGGKYAMTLKGGSCDNEFEDLTIQAHGKSVDIEIGNWSDQNYGDNTRNVFYNVQSADGKPVTYCYRWGSRPRFIESNVRHLWWRSIGVTIYWWAKLFWMGFRG